MDKPKHFAVTHVATTGKELMPVVERIANSIDGVPTGVAVAACLAVAIGLEAPDLEQDEYLEAIWEMSSMLVEYLTGENPFDDDMTRH